MESSNLYSMYYSVTVFPVKQHQNNHLLCALPCTSSKVVSNPLLNLPTSYWQNILVQSRKLYGWLNRTRQHYVTSPGSMARYGECTQTCTFENHANLLAYLTNWLLCTLENGFQGIIKCQGGLFLSFAQAFSALIWINCQNGVPLKHSFVYCRLHN